MNRADAPAAPWYAARPAPVQTLHVHSRYVDGADTLAAMAEAAVKSRAVSGSYSGNGSTRSVNLGFQPQAVLVENWRGTAVNAGMRGLGLWGKPLNPEAGSLTLTETGFTAGQNCCSSGVTYYYLAVK